MVPVPTFCTQLRDKFDANKDVQDVRVIDMLVVKVGRHHLRSLSLRCFLNLFISLQRLLSYVLPTGPLYCFLLLLSSAFSSLYNSPAVSSCG